MEFFDIVLIYSLFFWVAAFCAWLLISRANKLKIKKHYKNNFKIIVFISFVIIIIVIFDFYTEAFIAQNNKN